MEEHARKQVEAFIKVMQDDYGISIDDLRSAIERNNKVSKWGDWIAKTIVTSVAVGLVYAVWEGIKHFIRGS